LEKQAHLALHLQPSSHCLSSPLQSTPFSCRVVRLRRMVSLELNWGHCIFSGESYAKAIEELFDECILLFKLQKMSTKGILLFTSPFIMG
jgi:hypothetical protein